MRSGVAAQENAVVAQTPQINFRERPRFTTDPQRMRRTVQVDGVLNDGEWDPFYTLTEGLIRGVFYANWDENYLYLAARTEQPALVIFDVDAGGDGWLRGADNFEVVVGNTAEGTAPSIVARLLDAANSKDTPFWNDKSIDPKNILLAVKNVNGTQIVEIGIPKNMGSLVLRPGANIGLRAEFLPIAPANSYMPTQPFEPHLLLDASLVESRVQAMAGINPRLQLSDIKCIAGQTLEAEFTLLNQTDQAVPVKSVLWQGVGNSASAVNTLREVAVTPIPPMKTLKLRYRTVLPPNLSPGSYTLLATAEMENGKQAQSSATFAVVEPLQVQMASEPAPVAIVGTTKLFVLVDVYSAAPRSIKGLVELSGVPNGWELSGTLRRGFEIDRGDARKVVRVPFKLPSTTPAGDYPIEATVTWDGRGFKRAPTVVKVRTVVRVQRTDGNAAPAPAETKPAPEETKP
jgi:hypothetical protein